MRAMDQDNQSDTSTHSNVVLFSSVPCEVPSPSSNSGWNGDCDIFVLPALLLAMEWLNGECACVWKGTVRRKLGVRVTIVPTETGVSLSVIIMGAEHCYQCSEANVQTF